MRFYLPSGHFHRTYHFLIRNGGNAVALGKGILRQHVDLPPLVSEDATGIHTPIGNSEVLSAIVCKSSCHSWSDANRHSFRHKSLMANYLNAKHPFETVHIKSFWRETIGFILHINLKFQRHNDPLIILLRELEPSSTPWSIKMSECQM